MNQALTETNTTLPVALERLRGHFVPDMRLHTNLTRQSITLSYRMLLGAGFLARWPNDPAIYVRHVSTMLLELRRLRAEERQRAEMKAGRCD